MRILFVHDHRFFEQNGIYFSTKFTEATWEPYVMGGNTVVVYARRTNTPCHVRASFDRVEFNLTDNFSSPVSSLTNLFKLRKELEQLMDSCNRVIVRLPSVLGVIASDVAIKKGKKIMAEVVGDAYDTYHYYGNLSGKLLAPLFKHLNRRAISRCDAAIYVTQEFLQKRYPMQGLQAACSDVLIDDVSPNVLKERIRRNNLHKDKLVCGEIGNVSVPYKGYEIMFKAMKILLGQNIRVEYHIVGGGEPTKMMGTAAKYGVDKAVFYEGMMDHNQINDFYDKIDVYTHPSYSEGLPRVIVEAISRGCPCAVSDAGGTPELVDVEFIHCKGDANKLADDLLRFFQNAEIMNRASISNFERAKGFYASVLKKQRMNIYDEFYKL